MLDLGLIIARLQTLEGMTARVALAATIADAVALNVAQDRYLWIASPNSASDAGKDANRTVQRSALRFSIVALVRNVQDAAGAGALAEMALLRQAVIDALLGWEPAEGHGPIEHIRDAALSWDGARLYWADEFRSIHYLRGL